MVGSLGGKSLCFRKHFWKIRRNVDCQPGVPQYTISDRLLFTSHFGELLRTCSSYRNCVSCLAATQVSCLAVQYRYVNIVHEKLANSAFIASNCTQRLDKHLPDGMSQLTLGRLVRNCSYIFRIVIFEHLCSLLFCSAVKQKHAIYCHSVCLCTIQGSQVVCLGRDFLAKQCLASCSQHSGS